METVSTLKKVRIRMYCQGFGDCFLLSFFHKETDSDSRQMNILIDFGVWREEDGKPTLDDVAQDIAQETKGKNTILVITHEHKDHLSGFYTEMRKKYFEDNNPAIQFNQLWLAWTEDVDNNPLAKNLHEQFKYAINNLVKTQSKLQGLFDDKDDHFDPLNLKDMKDISRELLALELGTDDEELDEFIKQKITFDGESNAFRANTNNEKLSPNRAAMAAMKQIVGKLNVKYFKPGQLIEYQPSLSENEQLIPPGIKFFVLGPPEDLGKLQRDSSDAPGDLYLDINLAGKDDYSFSKAFDDRFKIDYQKWVDHSPFDDQYFCPMEFDLHPPEIDPDDLENCTPRQRELCKQRINYLTNSDAYKHYFIGEDVNDQSGEIINKTSKAISQADNASRRIDLEWLRASQSLALNLNSHTNNTSLVLAIELDQIDPDTNQKPVLLFPGDAQLGNWESWFDSRLVWTFPKTDQEAERTVTAQDLLKRTIFYKVSHHGSHNATPQNKGLKLMTDDKLIAMIPVSGEFAKTRKPRPWPIPYRNLIDEFKARPVDYVRSDEADKPNIIPKHEGKIKFTHKRVNNQEDKPILYVEYEIDYSTRSS